MTMCVLLPLAVCVVDIAVQPGFALLSQNAQLEVLLVLNKIPDEDSFLNNTARCSWGLVGLKDQRCSLVIVLTHYLFICSLSESVCVPERLKWRPAGRQWHLDYGV